MSGMSGRLVGMAEYAPDTLVNLGKAIARAIPGGEFSGVLGDKAHTYGYHRARNKLPGSDYSRTLERDKAGDGWAASAVDVKFSRSSQQTVTRRLLAAAKAKDPRLKALREFFGSLDSQHVRGYDLAYHKDSNNADDSHLWHVHLSIFRKYANNADAVKGILSVIKGDDMSLDKKDAKVVWSSDGIIPAPAGSSTVKTNPHWKASYYIQRIGQATLYDTPAKVKALDEKITAQGKVLDEIKELLTGQAAQPEPAAPVVADVAAKRGRKKLGFTPITRWALWSGAHVTCWPPAPDHSDRPVRR